MTADTHDESVRAIAREHDENFPMLFALLPKTVRADMRALYAFCRRVDDIGDGHDGAGPDRLGRLDELERDLMRCWDGEPHDPRMRDLAVAVRRRGLEAPPFLRLVEANRIDQATTRYATYADLIDYCRHSATPVGELVLAILGHRDSGMIALSDHTCIGLQLVNFWQDVRRDLVDNDRVYLPAEDMDRFGVTEAMLHEPVAVDAVRELIAFEVARARAELLAGAPLASAVRRRARIELRMFTAGGLALCDAIARADYDTLRRRPAPGRLGRARIAAAVLTGMLGRSR